MTSAAKYYAWVRYGHWDFKVVHTIVRKAEIRTMSVPCLRAYGASCNRIKTEMRIQWNGPNGIMIGYNYMGCLCWMSCWIGHSGNSNNYLQVMCTITKPNEKQTMGHSFYIGSMAVLPAFGYLISGLWWYQPKLYSGIYYVTCLSSIAFGNNTWHSISPAPPAAHNNTPAALW
jgi:hypothetical protein